MRYFKTNWDNWLYFKWDEETQTMWYSGSPDDDERWRADTDDTAYTPETLNLTWDGVPIKETDQMFCYETDENWNRL